MKAAAKDKMRRGRPARSRAEVRSSKFEAQGKTEERRLKTEVHAVERRSFEIQWKGVPGGGAGVSRLVCRVVAAALDRHLKRSARISVVGVGDKLMAQLNEQHLGHVGPTDVLTFDLYDGGVEVEGEIVISVDTARREAQRRGHSTSAEIALYAVHGTLHLLGYDDHEPRKARRMHAKEDEILEACGLGAIFRGSKVVSTQRPKKRTSLRPPLVRGEGQRPREDGRRARSLPEVSAS